ncbi:DUF5809 family protein [Salinibaculum salinum]|uniref:DUF5809 family protein n=1 Tax=Salinibaculum salinum TaxID=3131996 RepID=UPI0030EF7EDA
MDTEGLFAPETAEAARERYDALGPTAQTVVREVTRAMAFDAAEYDDRVSSEVVETARDALFASMLEVRVGTRAEFDEWREATEYAVTVEGSENVDNAVWHVAPFAEEAVAATYHEKRRAAVATLRRQAFGRIYREVV